MWIGNRQDYVSGYGGKYKKSKLDENIQLALFEIDGMQLIDIHFAIACKSTGLGNRGYSVKRQYIAKYLHCNLSGQDQDALVPNPVYSELENGRFIIHKFDEGNDDIVFGTPFIKRNQFKGITFEVSEDTDVKSRDTDKGDSSYIEA